ncbi:MAG: hypothetical protein IEMM0008_0484 [bacterium]|nr:MAG: hypothetical protein IEMM0008_0484 [bacterium]
MSPFFNDIKKSLMDQKKSILLFLSAVLLFAYVIWWLTDRLDLSFPTVLISFVAASFLGFVLSFSELRFYVLALILIICFFLVYTLGYVVSSYLQATYIDKYDFATFHFKRQFYLIAVSISMGFVFHWFLFRWKGFFYFVILFVTTLMVLLFKKHRNYQFSQLNLEQYLSPGGMSEIMLFFLFMCFLFTFIILFFFFTEETSSLKTRLQRFAKNKSNLLISFFSLAGLILIIIAVIYTQIKNIEPLANKGFNEQFYDKLFQSPVHKSPFLKLYPGINMNHKERKMVVKIENKSYSQLFGQTLTKDYHYLRWMVFSGFNQKRNLFFHEQDPFERDITANSKDHYFRLSPNPNKANRKSEYRSELKQEYYIIRFPGNATLAINSPSLTHPIKNKDPKVYTSAYRVISHVFKGSVNDLMDVADYDDMTSDFMKYYTKTPLDPAYQNMAKRVTAGLERPVEKVNALVKYLLENYNYTLSPGGEKVKDKLSYFLFKNKRGYCSNYASALTALTRSLNIPSRLVVGFVTDPYNRVENYYLLHGNNLHAWVEVYFKEYGWITFDGTPGSISEDQPHSDINQLNDFIASLERTTEDLIVKKKSPVIAQKGQDSSPINKSIPFQWQYLFLLVPFSLIIILSVKQFYRFRCHYTKSPIKKIYLYYLFIQKSLQDLLIKREAYETPDRFAERLYGDKNIDIREITVLYLKAKYSDQRVECPSNTIIHRFKDWQMSVGKHFPLWKVLLSRFNILFFLKN